MKGIVDGLSAVHSAASQYGNSGDSARRGDDRKSMSLRVSKDAHETVEHPVVRTHPVSGKRCLYVNRPFTERIVGMRASESDMLLNYLYDHCEREQLTCRVRWEPGTVTMWDNRAVMHRRTAINPDQPRVMHRTLIKGDPVISAWEIDAAAE